MSFCVTGIHPQKQRSEQGGLVAAGSLPDLHDHVAVGIRILGQQQQLELVLLLLPALPQFIQFTFGQFLHFGDFQHFLRFRFFPENLLIFPISLHRRLQRGMFLQKRLPFGLIGDDVRLTERL